MAAVAPNFPTSQAPKPKRNFNPSSNGGSNPLSLDVVMQSLSEIDRQGPMTSTAKSPFLASPIIASTLLFSANKIAKNAEPPLMSPSSPIVMHPIAFPNSADLKKAGVEVKQSQVLFEGQIKPVAVSAFEDLLFLVRIAKWKVAYQQGEAFDRQEQLPYCE